MVGGVLVVERNAQGQAYVDVSARRSGLQVMRQACLIAQSVNELLADFRCNADIHVYTLVLTTFL